MLEWLQHGGTNLLRAGSCPTAAMYLFYGAFCVVGLLAWWRVERAHRVDSTTEPITEGAPA